MSLANWLIYVFICYCADMGVNTDLEFINII